MKNRKLWTYIIFIGISEAVGILSGLLTRNGMDRVMELPKSGLTPPSWVFPIVWTVLFLLMGVGAARVWLAEEGSARSNGLWFYVFQLIFNFFWSLLFFNMQWFGAAFIWLILLWILIAGMAVNFHRADKAAGLLQIPYLVWVTFAGYLNYVVWALNS